MPALDPETLNPDCAAVQGLEWKPQKPSNEAAYADAALFREFVAVVKVRAPLGRCLACRCAPSLICCACRG